MERQNKLKLFIVDDDNFCSSVFQQYLNNINFTNIQCFTNDNDCIDNLDQNPDIIFLDYNMEDLASFDALKKIKRHNPNIYVIMVSGQENITTAINALKYGAFDYMVKDANICKKMGQVIEQILKIKEELEKSNPTTIQKFLSFTAFTIASWFNS